MAFVNDCDLGSPASPPRGGDRRGSPGDSADYHSFTNFPRSLSEQKKGPDRNPAGPLDEKGLELSLL